MLRISFSIEPLSYFSFKIINKNLKVGPVRYHLWYRPVTRSLRVANRGDVMDGRLVNQLIWPNRKLMDLEQCRLHQKSSLSKLYAGRYLYLRNCRNLDLDFGTGIITSLADVIVRPFREKISFWN